MSTLPVTLLALVTLVVKCHGVSGSDPNTAFLEALGRVSIGQVVKETPESGLNQSCFDPADDYSNLTKCLRSQCISKEDVASLYGTSVDEELEGQQLINVTPGLLYVLTQKQSCSSEILVHHVPPTTAAVWGYSFLFVTLINLCSLFGAIVLPCMNHKVYKVVLMFMVALAVGTLVGSGLLVLIPEALGLTESEEMNFLWKMCTVMGGVYLFFLVERIMRIINSRREDTADKREMDRQAIEGTYTSTFQTHSPENPHNRLKDVSNIHVEGFSNCAFKDDDHHHHRPDGSSSGDLVTLDGAGKNKEAANHAGGEGEGGGIGGGQRKRIAPVAYMIIFGDALHNLIDGLSIGAAFTESTLLGISLSVAVMCEELPHELGDFAILLNSGMSMRKALLYNFLSSLSCYIGLIIGIVLGENTSANTWIFAIAGGMFLYISLADMLPEMNSAAETQDGKEFGDIKTLLVQNFGLLVGFGIILVLGVYGGHINFE